MRAIGAAILAGVLMIAMSGCAQPEDDPMTCVLEYGGKARTKKGATMATNACRLLHRADASDDERAFARCVLSGYRDAKHEANIWAFRQACNSAN